MTLTVEDATIGYTAKGCIVAVASDGLEVVDGGHVNVGNQTSVESALALIDGCGTGSALTRVLIPMAAPGIVTALIFVFINAWNEYTIATVLISTSANRPITVGITQFSSFNMIEWQYLFAASLVATIPVVLLFMSIEKHLTSGLTSGGVKG